MENLFDIKKIHEYEELLRKKIKERSIKIPSSNPITQRGSRMAIFRHARRGYESYDISDFGKEATGVLSQKLSVFIKDRYGNDIKKILIYHSPLWRAEQTADVLKTGLSKEFSCETESKDFLLNEKKEINNKNITLCSPKKGEFVIFIGHAPDISHFFSDVRVLLEESTGFFEDLWFDYDY